MKIFIYLFAKNKYMEEADSLIEQKITKQKGMTRIEMQCWVSLLGENETATSHRRKISEFSKIIKKKIYDQKNKYADNYEYFVDVDIRDSPSTFAFLSLGVTFVKNNTVIKLNEYPKIFKDAIRDYHYFQIFKNGKKKRKDS